MRRQVLCWAAILAVLAAGIRLDATVGFGLIQSAEAKDYYTKKRVNGRWITGRFAKRSDSRSAAAEHSADTARQASQAETKVAAIPASTAVPPRAPARLLNAVPATSVPAAPIAAPAGAQSAAAAVDTAQEHERLDKLRQGLQARANALTTGSVAPQQASRPAPEPHSVSLDFRSGIKTTLFSDGTMIREVFDVAALKSLAAVPAEPKGGR